VLIIGAGLAGLLAGRILGVDKILEAQTALPNNHHALLRFRGQQFSKAVHIDFKPVQVRKAVYSNQQLFTQSNPQLDNMYSLKANGQVQQRSIMNLETAERWIAPPDLIVRLAEHQYIVYNQTITSQEQLLELAHGEPVISTIPLPRMLKLMQVEGYQNHEFPCLGLYNYTTEIISPEVNTYQTIYYPVAKDTPFHRISITGNQITAETKYYISEENAVAESHLKQIFADSFGFVPDSTTPLQCHYQQYGKLLPMKDQQFRRRCIMEMTDRWQVYSLGRFATWRQLLLDDLVQDVELIGQMISGRRSYKTYYYKQGEKAE